MNMYSNGLAAALITVTFTTAAIAGPGTHGRGKEGKFMAFFDTNQDNIVTIDELNSASKNRFSKMDVDGNNLVSREEFEKHISARRTERRAQAFKTIDTNADGQISKDEFLSHKQRQAENHFQNMDRNSDGSVSAEEFAPIGHNKHHKKYGHRGGKNLFSKLDANNDGQISQDESIAAWTSWFKRMDENNDQIVTLDELKAFRAGKIANH